MQQIFHGNSHNFLRAIKVCVAGCHDERQHLSNYSIWAVLFQLPGVTTLVVHSRFENQASDQLEVAHGRRFPANPTTDTPSPC